MKFRLKFDQGKWHELGKGEPFLPIQYKEHPDGARPGSHWMKDIVSFSHLKITNDPENKDNKLICVQSMHKYIPVVTIKRVGDFEGEDFRLKLTEFVVVTAYQSEDMIKLKVSHNKFASGFRSSGKRSNSTEPENSPPKRRSTSSASNSSTPPTVSPPAWDQPLNVLTPVVFNQNTYQNPDMFPAQNPPFYWNPLYQGHAFDYNQMYMNPWNNGFPGM
uniref:T-box domain-containing protein n=1 Tax=Caenorhabditis tropicalis TaxID=1561998 RepID=A0A1I7TF21_9PELO